MGKAVLQQELDHDAGTKVARMASRPIFNLTQTPEECLPTVNAKARILHEKIRVVGTSNCNDYDHRVSFDYWSRANLAPKQRPELCSTRERFKITMRSSAGFLSDYR